MISKYEVLDTIRMIDTQNLDVRTITMGISLRDCVSASAKTCCDKIKRKIFDKAKNLVNVGDDIAREFGVPIVNKRISVTPIAEIAASSGEYDYTIFAKALDQAAFDTGVNFIGGFGALVHKGETASDTVLLCSLASALSSTERVCAFVNIAHTRTGINMDAVAKMGAIIKETALLTKKDGGKGCAKLVVFANAIEDNPFMAGAFCGAGEPECAINVGVSGPGVVKSALENVRGESFDVVAETIKKTAFRVTRVGQLVAKEASQRLGVSFGVVDLSLAPTPAVGDSVARILEEIGVDICGMHGTTAALALLNDAVKKGGVMASSHVGGLSGAFIPVSEDEGMIEAVKKGALSLEKLKAMTCVCSVGLDMVAIPGDTPASVISAIIADEAAIGIINSKTTGVRIIPVPGAKVGECVEYGGLLGSAVVMDIGMSGCERLIARGGRIPAPLQGIRN
ncbi:MAG: PFL family protein [Christensenellales bacterium]